MREHEFGEHNKIPLELIDEDSCEDEFSKKLFKDLTKIVREYNDNLEEDFEGIRVVNDLANSSYCLENRLDRMKSKSNMPVMNYILGVGILTCPRNFELSRVYDFVQKNEFYQDSLLMFKELF